jgi:prepilin-type N-terminal cleavage/methylation domain-containing protein
VSDIIDYTKLELEFNQMTSPKATRKRGNPNSYGFTLTEILVALAVLGFALVPLMGVMWSGVRQTDISNTYANASAIGASILEYLLNDSVRFQEIDFTDPSATPLRDGASSRESAGLTTTTVGVNDFLGDYCFETAPPSKCQSPMSKARYFKIGRDNYYTDLYIGAYYSGIPSSAGATTWVSYGYLDNPFIDYERVPNNPQLFYDTLTLSSGQPYPLAVGNGDYQDYSPYYQTQWSLDPAVHNRRGRSDSEISMPLEDPTVPFNYLSGSADPARYTNFSKIQLFIRWGWKNAFVSAGTDWSDSDERSQIDSRGGAKMIELVTFKGRFR